MFTTIDFLSDDPKVPELVPPTDRQYTLQFFYGTKNHPINTNDDGQKVFEYVMRYMYGSSLPKILDNLVINCVRKGITLKKIV